MPGIERSQFCPQTNGGFANQGIENSQLAAQVEGGKTDQGAGAVWLAGPIAETLSHSMAGS